MPTPPQPKTTTDDPGRTLAVLIAAPTPVVTPQPISEATSNGTSSSILIAACDGTTISSANVPVPAKAEERLIALLEMRNRAGRETEQAELGLTTQTVGTGSARWRPRDDHVIAFGQAGHAVADADDLARTLVPEHHGDRGGDRAVHARQVGVTDTGRRDAHLHLARAGAVGRDAVGDVELVVADRPQDCRLHRNPPVVTPAPESEHVLVRLATVGSVPRMPDLGFWALAQDDPTAIALVEPDGRELTSGELLGESNRVVHGMRALGLQPGDAIAMVLPNGAEVFELYLAALQAGWYLVPINHHLVGPEIAYIVERLRREGVRGPRALRRRLCGGSRGDRLPGGGALRSR